jgi:hypothetical protein
LEQLSLLKRSPKPTGSELEPRFISNSKIQKAGYLSNLVKAIANLPLPQFGQGLIQGVLQAFLYHLEDMHKLKSPDQRRYRILTRAKR